jgi:DNA-binding transcriptional LysR family regulator
MLDVAKLATLRAVVAHGSFSSAGHALNLTQPAVSRQVSLLERQVGTQLVRRTQQGVHPTEAGRLLVAHADAILERLALAEAEIADVAGLRRGRLRLGSFFTALVYLSSELAALLEERHPDLYAAQPDVIGDALVDRAAALRGLAAGELDLAIVFEHEFESRHAGPAWAGGGSADVEVVDLFADPPRVLLPAGHPLAGAAELSARDLAGETWVRAHRGSAARLVDDVAGRGGVEPAVLAAGHGDEPVEAQAFVAAGRGITIAHALTVRIAPEQIAVVPLAGGTPVRRVQAALMREQLAPLARAALDALREVGRRRGGAPPL